MNRRAFFLQTAIAAGSLPLVAVAAALLKSVAPGAAVGETHALSVHEVPGHTHSLSPEPQVIKLELNTSEFEEFIEQRVAELRAIQLARLS